MRVTGRKNARAIAASGKTPATVGSSPRRGAASTAARYGCATYVLRAVASIFALWENACHGLAARREPSHPADSAEKAAGRPGDARPQTAARRPVLATHPGVSRGRRENVPRSPLASEEHDHERPEAAEGARRSRLARVRRRRGRGFQESADERAREPVLALARGLASAVRRSAAHPVHSAQIAASFGPSQAPPRFAE